MSAEAAVDDLCAAIGVGAQPLPLMLRFERSGDVHIEKREGFVLVYVARNVPLHRRGVAAAALRLVHPDRGLPHPIRAAFRGDDTLVLLCRLPENRVDLPTLDGIMQTLVRLADEAEAAG
jgi:type III secretion system chaperone SycN